MIFLRPLFLLACDLIINGITKLRKLGAISIGDVYLSTQPTIISKNFLPYDVVCSVEDSKDAEGLIQTPVIGSKYKTGTVIGYKGLNKDGTPKYIKVAFFNTAEINIPDIKLFKPEDLFLLYPTLDSVKDDIVALELETAMNLSKFNQKAKKKSPISEIDELFDLDIEDGGDDNNGGGNIIH